MMVEVERPRFQCPPIVHCKGRVVDDEFQFMNDDLGMLSVDGDIVTMMWLCMLSH